MFLICCRPATVVASQQPFILLSGGRTDLKSALRKRRFGLGVLDPDVDGLDHRPLLGNFRVLPMPGAPGHNVSPAVHLQPKVIRLLNALLDR